MKKLIAFLFLAIASSLSVKAFPQISKAGLNISFKVIITDALGKQDSAASINYLLMDTLSPTLGIDSAWDEVNLYGTAYNDLDVRAIERTPPDSSSTLWFKTCIKYDWSDWNCFRYYKYNTDLKANYFNSSERQTNCIFKIHAINFPIHIDLQVVGNFPTYLYGKIFTTNRDTTDTAIIGWKYLDIPIISNDSSYMSNLYTINSASELGEGNFVIIGTEEINVFDSKTQPINIYPNPTDGIITVPSELNSNWQIANSDGIILKNGACDENNTKIDVSNLTRGTYFIKIKEHKYKFVKE